MAFKLFPDKPKQWKVVLIAFVTATTFWFFNSLNKNYTTTLNHPVVFTFPGDSLVAVKKLPSNIELDVTGGGWNLLRKSVKFNVKPVVISIKNPSSPFISWMEVLPSIREQMTEITVNRVLQDTLNIRIEPIISKKLLVVIDSLNIGLRENFRLVSPILVAGNLITLTGPKSFIDTLGTTYTVRIPEDEINANYAKKVEVQVPMPHLISSSPSEIEVSFDVEPFDRLQIELPIVALRFPTDSSRYLDEQVATVYFTVQRSKRGEYVKKNFRLVADFKTITRRDTVITPVLEIAPAEIMEVDIAPKQIKINKK